jgi:hypothetical protein
LDSAPGALFYVGKRTVLADMRVFQPVFGWVGLPVPVDMTRTVWELDSPTEYVAVGFDPRSLFISEYAEDSDVAHIE